MSDTWTTLFCMMVENASTPQEELRQGINDAKMLVDANEDVFGTAFKLGWKKTPLSSLIPPLVDFISFQKVHIEVTQVDAKL